MNCNEQIPNKNQRPGIDVIVGDRRLAKRNRRETRFPGATPSFGLFFALTWRLRTFSNLEFDSSIPGMVSHLGGANPCFRELKHQTHIELRIQGATIMTEQRNAPLEWMNTIEIAYDHLETTF